MNEDTAYKILLQGLYCTEKKVPFFAPRDSNSWCCHKNIWERISEEKARNELVTGCPICHRSYVD
jgi:hypothetical protein